MEFSLSGFNSLHNSLKAFIIGLLMTMPVWYLDIYFLAPHRFFDSPYMMIVVAYVITLAWFMINLIFTIQVMKFVVNPVDKARIVEYSLFFSVFDVLLFSGVCYISSTNFLTLVVVSFSMTAFLALILKIAPVPKPVN